MPSVLLAITTTLIGTLLGAIEGHSSGYIAILIQQIIPLKSAVPIAYIILLCSIAKPLSTSQLWWILCLTQWSSSAQIARTISISDEAIRFLRNAQLGGISRNKQLINHLLPFCLSRTLTQIPWKAVEYNSLYIALDMLNIHSTSSYYLGHLLTHLLYYPCGYSALLLILSINGLCIFMLHRVVDNLQTPLQGMQ